MKRFVKSGTKKVIWHKIGALNIGIDRDRCIGSGNCVKVAPEIFELDDECISVIRPDWVEIEEARLIEACEVCPVDALYARDENGRQIIPSPPKGERIGAD